MDCKSFLKDNLVKEIKPDFKQIEYQLKRAVKDLKTANSVMTTDLTWAFAIAYHATIRASKALMYSKGYLPTANKSHKTIVEFTKMILGEEYDSLMAHFNRMRRRRHEFIYDSKNHITLHEAKESIDTAKKLIEQISNLIAKESPEKDFFR